jgi:hypothetical protein
MNDPVEFLMKRSILAARKYEGSDRKLLQIFDRQQRIGWTDPLSEQLQRQKIPFLKKCGRCRAVCRAGSEGERNGQQVS